MSKGVEGLLATHARLPRYVAAKFIHRTGLLGEQAEDLQQEAALEMVLCASSYRPELASFPSHAIPRMSGALYRYAMGQGLFRTHYRAKWKERREEWGEEALRQPDGGVGPEEAASAAEMVRKVVPELLGRLGATRKHCAQDAKTEASVDAFMRSRFDGESVALMARVEGVSKNALSQRVLRVEAVFEEWAQEVRAA